MRKLQFGTYRGGRPRIVRWLDVNNLAGIFVVVWTLVVGFTGVLNTSADLVIKIWQFGRLASHYGVFMRGGTPLTSRMLACLDRCRDRRVHRQPRLAVVVSTLLIS